ncbi:sulfate transporter 2.1-like isoform X2 [Panicum miliaceum]|uniref:Sulfate transporter 2.1-like isoform X2 n=1 Tax=Panicum miliaceum TaxID=4540 RepID=A0A3L6SEZ0_PANMI|nr:sulfate transporter 2.1-like isoform X2 [Panicum miliaceum]
MEKLGSVQLSATVPSSDVSRRPDTTNLVVNCPGPPSLREKLVSMIGDVFLPPANGGAGRPPWWTWVMTALQFLFPVLKWGRSYSLKSFRSDIMAGLTLASLGIPQDTSVVPPLVYAVMGTSKEIAFGPVAVISLLLSSMIEKIVDPAADPGTYRGVVFTVTFLAGVFQISFGLFRLGFLVEFLSHAAIVGFMAGAAIVIGMQQLKALLGLTHFTNNTDVVSVVKAVYSDLHDDPWHPGNFFIGFSFLVFILSARFVGRKYKKLSWMSSISPLLSVIFSTAAVYATRADRHNVKIIRDVHAGSFSRTAVNFSAGATSTVSDIVMAVTVFIALELLAKLLYYTPMAVLASIILSALPGLIDVKEAHSLWKVDKLDFMTCLGAFVGVLFWSVEAGLAVAIAVSFAKIIVHSVRPQVEILGRFHDTDTFCNTKQYPMVGETPTVLTARIGTSFLCFVNANSIRERITGWVAEKREEVRSVVLDVSNVVDIDTAGLAAPEGMRRDLASRGVQMALASPGWRMIHKMRLGQLVAGSAGGDWILLTVARTRWKPAWPREGPAVHPEACSCTHGARGRVNASLQLRPDYLSELPPPAAAAETYSWAIAQPAEQESHQPTNLPARR